MCLSFIGKLLGFGSSKPTVLPPPPLPSPPEKPASLTDPAVRDAGEAERRRRVLAQGGRQGTILTTPLGLTDEAGEAFNTLLGR